VVAPGLQRPATHKVFSRQPLVTNVIELHPIERPADDDHDIDSGKEDLSRRTECLSDEPFRTISNGGGADPA